jgi:hypothetical protein
MDVTISKWMLGVSKSKGSPVATSFKHVPPGRAGALRASSCGHAKVGRDMGRAPIAFGELMDSMRRRWLLFVALTMVCVFCLGCGSKSPEGDGGGSRGSATDGGSGYDVGTYDGPTSPGPNGVTVTQLDGGPSETGLPALPELTNVFATQREDSVGIDFDPVDNAIDYRVYPLPSPSDLTVNSDGSLTIKNAIYRCAGLRQAFELPNATLPPSTDGGQDTVNQNQQYSWIATVPTNPTLGYVYPIGGPGLVPVYAIAVHPAVPEIGWRESRPKIYTTSASLRQTWLSQGARDDGVVFYVPSSASSSTETVYHSETALPVGGQNWTQYTEYYFTKADLATHAMDSTPPAPAFQILSAPADGAKPLMAVFYQPGMNHTELAVGNERFTRAAHQSFGPLWHLEWSGITAETTLVVEALSSGCPFQGFLSPQSIDAPPHQPLETLAQLQAASTTGEVFINGQYDLPGASWTILNPPDGGYWGTSSVGLPALETPSASPVPIARSFVKVMPQPHNPSDSTKAPTSEQWCPGRIRRIARARIPDRRFPAKTAAAAVAIGRRQPSISARTSSTSKRITFRSSRTVSSSANSGMPSTTPAKTSRVRCASLLR